MSEEALVFLNVHRKTIRKIIPFDIARLVNEHRDSLILCPVEFVLQDEVRLVFSHYFHLKFSEGEARCLSEKWFHDAESLAARVFIILEGLAFVANFGASIAEDGGIEIHDFGFDDVCIIYINWLILRGSHVLFTILSISFDAPDGLAIARRNVRLHVERGAVHFRAVRYDCSHICVFSLSKF